MTRVRSTAAWPILALSLLAGCYATPKPAIFWDSRLDPNGIGQIVVLPPVDSRIGRDADIDLETQVRRAGTDALQGRGYDVALGEAPQDLGEIIDEDLKNADPIWIKRLAPPGLRWIMVLELIEVTSQLTFGSTGNAEVAGYLFDAEQGRLVWRDKGIGQVGQGGLIGMALIAQMDDAALSVAMRNLVASLPVREK